MYPDNSNDGVGGYPMSIYKDERRFLIPNTQESTGVFVASGHYCDGEPFDNFLFCEFDALSEDRTDLNDDLIFFYGMSRTEATASIGEPIHNDFTITSVGDYV